jgi:hypothetical protein
MLVADELLLKAAIRRRTFTESTVEEPGLTAERYRRTLLLRTFPE